MFHARPAGAGLGVVSVLNRTFWMCNYLNINELQGVQGVPAVSGLEWGATLKNFFVYFSASVSYVLFVKFWKMAKKAVFGAEKCKVLNMLIFNKFGR